MTRRRKDPHEEQCRLAGIDLYELHLLAGEEYVAQQALDSRRTPEEIARVRSAMTLLLLELRPFDRSGQ